MITFKDVCARFGLDEKRTRKIVNSGKPYKIEIKGFPTTSHGERLKMTIQALELYEKILREQSDRPKDKDRRG